MGRARRKGRPIHGWLCIDKPEGLTSTEAVNRIRRITCAAKAGHGGTLDPLATGVLPIALGEATKTVPYIVGGQKHYRFTARLGEARTTDDSEGEVTAQSSLRPDTAAIERVLPEFVGVVEQVPPSFAAIKVDGERAYDRARRGEDVALEPREVAIDSLALVERPDDDHVRLELVCGKGTYVRAVVRDLGAKLGCFAHVTALRRLQVGPFLAANAISLATLAQLAADDALSQALVSLPAALEEMPALPLTGPQAERLRAGQKIRVSAGVMTGTPGEDGTVRAMAAGEIIALARFQGGQLSPVRVFNL
ncbi:MAG: tRNA pseudouridine(55) synthase TruB [Pseudomonadota bacterium]